MRKHLRLLLGIAVLVFATTFAKAQWSDIPSLPGSFSWQMTAEYGGKIYVFGGYVSDAVYTYTPGATAWEKLSVTMPNPRFGGYAAVVNNKIYIVGGASGIIGQGSLTTTPETYEFDPATNTFAMRAAIPQELAFFGGAVVNGRVYVMGGSDGTSSSFTDFTDIQIYDPATDSWTISSTATPYAAKFQASTVLDGKIYLIGGSVGTTYANQTWIGTPTGDEITWEKKANLPAGLTRGSAGTVNGKVLFAGGAPTPTSGFSNSYMYDPATNKWTTHYALPVATYNSGQLFGTGNELYFAGGYATTRAFKYTYTDVAGPNAYFQKTREMVNLKSGDLATITFPMSNLGTQSMTLTITVPDAAKGWLIPQASTVAVGVRTSKNVTFDVMSGSLASGIYTAQVAMATNDPLKPTITYTIALSVLPESISSQPTKVVVEEGTGDWCGYCPDGHRVLGELEDQFEDNVIILSYHGPAGEPMQILDGQAILDGLEIQGYPNAAIQRWMFPGQTQQMTNRGDWATFVQQVLDDAPNAGADLNVLSYSYDAGTKKFKATVEVTSKQPAFDGTLRLTAVLTEDGIHYRQVNYGPEGNYDDYIHDDVVRTVYPDHMGLDLDFPTESIAEGVIKLDSKVTREIEFDINEDITDPDWYVMDPANCHVTFMVGINDPSTGQLKSILQGARIPLVQASVKVSDVATTASVSNTPNPVAKSTKFTYAVTEPSIVNLAIYDVMGREVARLVSNESHSVGTYEANLNAAKLSNGTYTYVLTAGMQKVTGTMVVQK